MVRLNDPTSKVGSCRVSVCLSGSRTQRTGYPESQRSLCVALCVRLQVDALSVKMQEGLTEVMGEVWSNGGVKSAVLISSKPGCFIAGADVKY